MSDLNNQGVAVADGADKQVSADPLTAQKMRELSVGAEMKVIYNGGLFDIAKALRRIKSGLSNPLALKEREITRDYGMRQEFVAARSSRLEAAARNVLERAIAYTENQITFLQKARLQKLLTGQASSAGRTALVHDEVVQVLKDAPGFVDTETTPVVLPPFTVGALECEDTFVVKNSFSARVNNAEPEDDEDLFNSLRKPLAEGQEGEVLEVTPGAVLKIEHIDNETGVVYFWCPPTLQQEWEQQVGTLFANAAEFLHIIGVTL